jgi:hypothetical protein
MNSEPGLKTGPDRPRERRKRLIDGKASPDQKNLFTTEHQPSSRHERDYGAAGREHSD